MADWSSQNITLTAKGASALSKVQAGSGSLTITKVVASEQYVAESTLREVTSLSVENLPLTIIDRYEVQDGGSVIQVQLSNLYLGKAFTLNEIGVFATHSDNPSEEFLYIIAQVDAETGDKIPVYATTPVTATYDIYLYNIGADNIEITISSTGLVTYEALNKACDIIQRNTAYEVGDILHSHSLKKGLAIKCTVAGITKSTDTDLSHKNVGDTVEDGTSQWVVIAPSTTADFDAHNHSVDAHPELMNQLIESGLNVIKRSHSYAKGDIAYSDKIPSWAFLECIVAGTTSDGWYFPKPSEIKVDDTIVDYTVTWKVRKVADTASKLATARNIALTGNASGSASFDGTSDVNIDVTVNTATKAVNDGNGDNIANTYLKKATVIDVIYPVGSIYMSMSATNPHDLFGVGTWERISQGRMLLGADDSTYEAGATGGEATHTLTANEMPAHSHDGKTSWADLKGNLSNSDNDSITCSHSVGTSGIFSRGNGWGHFGGQASGDNVTTSLKVNASHDHSLSINSTGGGQAHNNMSPYLAVYIWQRTA